VLLKKRQKIGGRERAPGTIASPRPWLRSSQAEEMARSKRSHRASSLAADQAECRFYPQQETNGIAKINAYCPYDRVSSAQVAAKPSSRAARARPGSW
jgi:hypothetical protein